MGSLAIFERTALPVAIAVVAASTLFIYHDATLFVAARDQAIRTERIVSLNEDLLSALKDAETGQRGFLLTGRDEYLEPYRKSQAAIQNDLQQLGVQITRPATRANFTHLEQLVSGKLAALAKAIELRRTKGFDAAVAVVEEGYGKRTMDEIRTVSQAIHDEELGPMLAARQIAGESATRLRWLNVGSLVVLLILLSLAATAIRRGRERRDALIRELDASKREAAHARDTLDLTLRSIGDAVIATDDEGRVTFMNPAAQRLTGWQEENAKGQPLPRVFRIINERTRDTVESPVEKVLRLGTVVGLANHTILLNANGDEIPIDDSAAPMKAPTGKIGGVVLVFRDIGERRRAEKELERSRYELTQTNEALQRSNTDLEQFAYAVSHDLQAPLRTIASFSQLIVRSGGTGPQTAEYLRHIQNGVARMMDLIRDLLEYSRVTHETEAAPAPVNFQEVLGEVLWNLQAEIKERGAVIQADGLPTVMADKRSMVQLLQNVVGNALKYNGSKRPEVKVEAARRESGEWVLHVRDNGIGIDMRHAQQIFGVFTRLHGRDEYSGTGIGLAICRRIVELHGGKIWVESKLGEGCTFSFSLPGVEK
jgi:PAS domain S-box-containing protein